MELVVLGSGTVAPSARRTAPAHWVEAGDANILLDCGAGALHRAAQFGVPWSDVTHVALTHFHPDHWGELPMLIFGLRWGVEPPRSAPLHLLGPSGISERLENLARAFGPWVLEPDGYSLEVGEVAPAAQIRLAEGVVLGVEKTNHTEESVAFSITHDTASIVYTGDTGPSDGLARWARGCNLLLAECSLPEDRAIEVHLTPAQAGRLARDADAEKLVLTHFYPPVDAANPLDEAARFFNGAIVAAEDGDRFVVGEE